MPPSGFQGRVEVGVGQMEIPTGKVASAMYQQDAVNKLVH